MTEDERTLVFYRLQRAKEAVEEAILLFEASHVNAYVNRLYYACFYAVSALLLTKNMSTSKHGYLRSLMHKEFVKTGLIPTELGKHFDLLFDSRQEGDYGDLATFKSEEVADWLVKTKTFVEYVEKLINAT
jgi:uncharacterized protein (UPF0332 family)